MKRTILKFGAVFFAAVMLLGMLCACTGGENALVGTWYDAFDPEEEPLILTKDKNFTVDGVGGNYSVEGEQLILISPYESKVCDISKAEGKTCLIAQDGHYWFKSEEFAKKYYDREVAKILEKAKDENAFVGEYTLNNAYMFYDIHITLNDDGTYEYKDEKAWQKGTWKLTYEGELPDEEFCIELNMTEGNSETDISLDKLGPAHSDDKKIRTGADYSGYWWEKN